MNPLTDKGYIHVYTGMGKGKTTAALGLALRAIGHGHRVFIGQFMKGVAYGEIAAAARLGDDLVIERFGEDSFVHPEAPREEDLRRAEAGLARIREVMQSGTFQVVVLDEINVTVAFGLLAQSDVLALLDEKPDGVELVLTGIQAPEAFLERADLVTEMVERRHYFAQKGVLSRPGIDR